VPRLQFPFGIIGAAASPSRQLAGGRARALPKEHAAEDAVEASAIVRNRDLHMAGDSINQILAAGKAADVGRAEHIAGICVADLHCFRPTPIVGIQGLNGPLSSSDLLGAGNFAVNHLQRYDIHLAAGDDP